MDILKYMGYGDDGSFPPRPNYPRLPPQGWPTSQEVQEARDYKDRFGNENEVMFRGPRPGISAPLNIEYTEPGTPVRTVDKKSLIRTYETPGGLESVRKTPADQLSADNMYAGQIAANRSSLGYLGFDPDRTVSSPSGPQRFTLAGLYRPQTDTLWYDQDSPSSIVHETFHRAMKMVHGNARLPYPEELVVRASMLRHHGDIEEDELPDKNKDNPGRMQINEARRALKNPKFVDFLDETERLAGEMIAQKNMEKHPMGLGYSSGGPISAAQHVAAQGRYGDTTLVHMNPAEVRGLEAINGGRLPRNPSTGYPEAFGLGDILGLIGGVAGSFLLPGIGTEIGLSLGTAAGGGLGAFAGGTAGNLIEGKDAGTALGRGVAGGLLSYGLGSALNGLSGLGGAGADAAAGAATAAPAAGAGQAASTGAGAEAAAGGVQDWIPSAAGGQAPNSMATAAAPQFKYDSIDSLLQGGSMSDKLSGAANNVTNPDMLWDTFGKGAMKTTVPIGLGLYGSMGGFDAPQGQTQQQDIGGTGWRYPAASSAGTGRQYRPQPADPLGREHTYFYADGGMVSKQAEQRDKNGRRVISVEQAEREAQEYDERRAKGPSYNLDSTPIGKSMYPIYKYADGGSISGPGGGLDDAIPAIIDGRQPAQLSSGEYVVPAHAVSALGNGSSEHGIRMLDGMVDRTMQAKYGTKNRQPRPLDPAEVLPR